VGHGASIDTLENRVSFTYVTNRFPCQAHGLVTIATKLSQPPYIYIYMAQCPKWNAIVLKFLHHLKVYTLPGSTRFQHSPQPFAHTSVA